MMKFLPDVKIKLIAVFYRSFSRFFLGDKISQRQGRARDEC